MLTILKSYKDKKESSTRLTIKMMEDGAFSDIMGTHSKTLITDDVLITFINRNIEANIDAVKWYLDLLYPVSNKVVKHVIKTGNMSLIPYVYTAYCNRYVLKHLSKNEAIQLLDHFNEAGFITKSFIQTFYKICHSPKYYSWDYTLARYTDLIMRRSNINDMAIQIIPECAPLLHYHFDTYITNGGRDIRALNHVQYSTDKFISFCANVDIVDLSLLDDNVINEIAASYDRYKKSNSYNISQSLRKAIEKTIRSNSNNIHILCISGIDIYKEFANIISDIGNCMNIVDFDYIQDNQVTYEVIYSFLKHGNILTEIPDRHKYILDNSLYRTAVINNIENIKYIPETNKEEVISSPDVMEVLLRDETFMTIENKSIVVYKIVDYLTRIDSILNTYKRYPLLFRLSTPTTISRIDIQNLIMSNPKMIKYVSADMISPAAISHCINNHAVPLDYLLHCRLTTPDVYGIVRYNMHQLLMLPNDQLREVMSVFGESLLSVCK